MSHNKPNTGDTVLVTGGAGFIGSNVTAELVERGYNVVVLDSLQWGRRENLEGLDIELIQGDIRESDTVDPIVKRVDGVFHLAAHVGNRRSIEHPERDADINVLGTLSLLESIKKHDISKLVISSSAAIFGEVEYTPVDEDHPVNPDSPYGVTKLTTEKHALCYAQLFDIDSACLRYFNVYGPNQRYDEYGNVIPIWTHRLLNNEPLIIYGDGYQTRDFVNVRDAAIANVLAYESPDAVGPINIGTGKATTINELASIFREVSESEIEIRHDNPRKGEVKHSVASVDKAQQTMDYSPQIQLEDGVREYVEWMRSNNPQNS